MTRYRITAKNHARFANRVIDPDISAEMATMLSHPVTNLQAAEQLSTIFRATFGVDLKLMECLNSGYSKDR